MRKILGRSPTRPRENVHGFDVEDINGFKVYSRVGKFTCVNPTILDLY